MNLIYTVIGKLFGYKDGWQHKKKTVDRLTACREIIQQLTPYTFGKGPPEILSQQFEFLMVQIRSYAEDFDSDPEYILGDEIGDMFAWYAELTEWNWDYQKRLKQEITFYIRRINTGY